MAETELFKYRVVITGRLRAGSPREVEAQILAGLIMTLPLHESVDGISINSQSDMEELRRRFPEQRAP